MSRPTLVNEDMNNPISRSPHLVTLITPKELIALASINFMFLIFQTPSLGTMCDSPKSSLGAGNTRPIQIYFYNKLND